MQGLPQLTGSPKQIAWATTIRASVLTALEKTETEMRDPDTWPEWLSGSALQEICDAVALIASEIRNQTEARWWIDNGQQWRLTDAADIERRMLARHLCPTVEAERAAQRAAREAQRADQ